MFGRPAGDPHVPRRGGLDELAEAEGDDQRRTGDPDDRDIDDVGHEPRRDVGEDQAGRAGNVDNGRRGAPPSAAGRPELAAGPRPWAAGPRQVRARASVRSSPSHGRVCAIVVRRRRRPLGSALGGKPSSSTTGPRAARVTARSPGARAYHSRDGDRRSVPTSRPVGRCERRRHRVPRLSPDAHARHRLWRLGRDADGAPRPGRGTPNRLPDLHPDRLARPAATGRVRRVSGEPAVGGLRECDAGHGHADRRPRRNAGP